MQPHWDREVNILHIFGYTIRKKELEGFIACCLSSEIICGAIKMGRILLRKYIRQYYMVCVGLIKSV